MHKKHLYWFIFYKGALPLIEIWFQLSPPNEDGAELFSMIVQLPLIMANNGVFAR